jgi:glycine hydroxymethyltransferase
MNLLPFEPLRNVTHPAGIRLGVQEMTRVGMKQAEMGRIADFFKEILFDKKNITDDVKEFRSGYQEVLYSFDREKPAPLFKASKTR